MFVKNSFEYDARVTKEAKTLIGAGHDVTVVALYVPDVTRMEETTDDGIHVVRVPRSSFGVPALNRLALKYAGSIESRHVRLTGDTYNADEVRKLGQLSTPSTAAPGSQAPHETAQTAGPHESQGALKTLWGRVTTPVLRSFARFARFSFRIVKRVLGQQSQWLKHRAINRRMVRVGLASGADVFHSHDLNTLRVGAICKDKTGAKLVYDSHELQTERNRMTPTQKRKAIAEEGRYLPSADAMIVAGPSWIDWNRELYGAVPDTSVVLLNVPEQSAIDTTKDLRQALAIADKDRIVLYQGSIQENRGIEPAIDAVEQLTDVVLIIVGYGHHRPVLEDLVRRRGLTDKVKFFGPVANNELISYSASADVGLANIVNSSISYNTTLPNKLFEYAMAGIPVVGSEDSAIGTIVVDQRIGEICNAEDPDALAAAIASILADPTRYNVGLEATAIRYNWKVEQETLLGLYAAL